MINIAFVDYDWLKVRKIGINIRPLPSIKESSKVENDLKKERQMICYYLSHISLHLSASFLTLLKVAFTTSILCFVCIYLSHQSFYEQSNICVNKSFVLPLNTFNCLDKFCIQGQAYVPGQAISILHPRLICIFKNFFNEVCSYTHKLQKIFQKISSRIYG